MFTLVRVFLHGLFQKLIFAKGPIMVLLPFQSGETDFIG